MSILSCPDCNGKVSDTATACPHCGKPVNGAAPNPVAQPTSAPPAKSGSAFLDPKKNLRSLITVVVVLAVAGWLIYTFVLGREGKKAVNVIATQTGIGRTVIPWTDRAESVLKVMMQENKSGANVASTIQKICHPSGSKPVYAGFDVRKVGDTLAVVIRCNWKGGLLGTDYATVVNWEFKQSGHIRAAVKDDNSPFAVAADEAKKLDEYFRTEVYAVLRSNMGD